MLNPIILLKASLKKKQHMPKIQHYLVYILYFFGENDKEVADRPESANPDLSRCCFELIDCGS